jgi:hypothetical protein
MKKLEDLLTNKSFILKILKSINKDDEIQNLFSSEGVTISKDQVKALKFIFNETSKNEDFTDEVRASGAGVIKKVANLAYAFAIFFAGSEFNKRCPDASKNMMEGIEGKAGKLRELAQREWQNATHGRRTY